MQCEKDLQKMYSRIIDQEQQKYQERQTKRYHSFMTKVKEVKKDHERLYRR